jgi:peptide/nickel transport system permease protein
MISQYQSAFTTRPWLFWWPGLFIVILALCINFIGDGLRDAFDPRQQGKVSRRKANRAVAAIPSVQGVQMVEGPTSSDDERYMDEFGGGALPEPPAVEERRERGDQP